MKSLAGLVMVAPMCIHAGPLIDERGEDSSVEQKVATFSSRPHGKLTGAYKQPKWADPAPYSRTGGSRLGLAAVRLMPEVAGTSISIEAPNDLIDLMVEWPKDVNRKQALEHIAKIYGVNIDVNETSRVIRMIRSGEVFASSQGTKDAASTPQKSVTEQVASAANQSTVTTLQPGKGVASQLREMAQKSGYQLAWEVDDFTVDQPFVMGSDFLKALTTLVQSVNSDGTHIKAIVYKGNNLVRVSPL